MVDQNNYENTYSISVPCKGKKGFYRIQTTWDDIELKLTLLDDAIAYNTTISRSHLVKQAFNLEMNYDDYIKKILSSLQDDNIASYLYERKNEMFYIFRQQDNIKVTLASFTLEQVDYVKAVENFIDKLHQMTSFYKAQLETYKNDKTSAIKEKSQCVQKLEKYINLKEKSEKELYNKFILILNEKKTQLANVEKKLMALKEGIFEESDKEETVEILKSKPGSKRKTKATQKRKRVRGPETISDSDPEEVQTNNKVNKSRSSAQKKQKNNKGRRLETISDSDPEEIPKNNKVRRLKSISDSDTDTETKQNSNKTKQIETIPESDTEDSTPEIELKINDQAAENGNINKCTQNNRVIHKTCSKNMKEASRNETADEFDVCTQQIENSHQSQKYLDEASVTSFNQLSTAYMVDTQKKLDGNQIGKLDATKSDSDEDTQDILASLFSCKEEKIEEKACDITEEVCKETKNKLPSNNETIIDLPNKVIEDEKDLSQKSSESIDFSTQDLLNRL